MKVKRSKELDDDSPSKERYKRRKSHCTSGFRDGCYHDPILPESIYVELREDIKLHDMIQEDL